MSRPAASAVAAIIFAAGFLAGASSAPRPAAQPTDLRSPRRMTMDGPAPVPSPDYAVPMAEAPIGSPVASRLTPSPSPTSTRAAPTAKPRTAIPPRRRLSGTATWYCRPGVSACTAGYPSSGLYAAAGPALRVGAWRGRLVTVTAGGRSVRVRLVDTCACPGGRLIDLFASAFQRLAPLSAGVVRIEVRW
jgi:rare lipoprotein A (peptidoglycan hydrolase)